MLLVTVNNFLNSTLKSRNIFFMLMSQKKVVILCPIMDHPTEITEDDFRAALRHRKETRGVPLGSCKTCHRVFILPDTMPNTGAELAAWIASAEADPDGCCPCIPLLDRSQERSPAGSLEDAGYITYTPGDAGDALPKWPYMDKYGINPESYLAANPSMGSKPFKVGR